MNIKETLTAKLEKEYGQLTFGRALWAYRKGEEMTQTELSQVLGISSSSLCDLEKGRTIPTVRRAARIAKQIGQSEKVWVQLAVQDSFVDAGLNYKISVA
ncbi:helix-turn-helix transcriptional regulator [uncultured Desulfobacter sp.]|uniref:helix-turn-helix transcriptional regulator n=1 Tax=uncultured Desulfobacter sp. TaxID=240139 RepID=UPI0029C939DF|nr:helix-turn-helix transcriptional regulator [uncultured Desulfobacter sp.]